MRHSQPRRMVQFMIGASSESGSSRMGHQLRNMRGQRGKRIPRDSLAGFGSNQRLARERNREAAKDRTARACLRSPRAAARQLLYPLHSPPGLPGKHSREWNSRPLLHMRLQDPGPAFLKPTLCGAVSRRGMAGEREGGGEREHARITQIAETEPGAERGSGPLESNHLGRSARMMVCGGGGGQDWHRCSQEKEGARFPLRASLSPSCPTAHATRRGGRLSVRFLSLAGTRSKQRWGREYFQLPLQQRAVSAS